MGTWSAGSFGNDAALDYVEGLSSFDTVIETVAALSAQSKGLAAGDACAALAACDLLAAGLERPPGDLPELPGLKLRAVPGETLDQAKALVKHVRATSDLAELWEDEAEEWHDELDGCWSGLPLRNPTPRLSQSRSCPPTL